MGIITGGVRPWVIRTLRRYQANPGLVPRPALIHGLAEGRKEGRVREEYVALMYGAFVIRGELDPSLRMPDWDAQLGLGFWPRRVGPRPRAVVGSAAPLSSVLP